MRNDRLRMETCHNLEEASNPSSNFFRGAFGDIRRCNSRDCTDPVTGQHSSAVDQRQAMGWSVCDGGENLHPRVRSTSAVMVKSKPTAPTENINVNANSVYFRPIRAIVAKEKSVHTPDCDRTRTRGKWGSALGLLFFRRGALMRNEM